MAECFFQRLKQEENFHEAVPTMTQGMVDKLFHLSITLENLEEVLRRGRTELVLMTPSRTWLWIRSMKYIE